jgi:site-specific DNA-methyltransferase (adenine-specific)
MNIEKVNINEVKSNPNNPRLIKDDSFKKLVKSIKEFPQMLEIRPIVVDDNMIVLGGNMRLKACKEAGLKEIPIIKTSKLTDEQKSEFIIKDNIGYGEWDFDLLKTNWDTEVLLDWGLEIPDTPNNKSEDGDVVDDNFEVDENTKTDIVLGDIFEIGPHKLLCGDSTLVEDCKKLFGDNFADMVVTDPPYNVSYIGKTKDALTIENDKMKNNDFYDFLYNFYTSFGSYTKKGGSWYIWHAPSEIINFAKAFVDAGFLLKQQLIWLKNTMVMGRQDYQWKHEPCLYGWKEGAAHNWYSDRKQTTIMEFNKPSRNAEHPTMKPIELFAYQIKNSSKMGDIVGDGFLGSGTTMIACHQLERRCYGIELDPKYCQVIIDRMLKFDSNIKIYKNGIPYEKSRIT